MATRIVEANDRSYTVAPDGEVPLAQRFWGVVQARVVNELTGRPPEPPVFLDAQARSFSPHVADGGLIGFVARPAQVFPDLAGQSYPVSFTVRAEGFVPRHEEVTVPQDPLFPVQFVPLDLGDLALHREPVVLTGRTIRRTNSTITPVSHATVTVTGLWRELVPAATEPPPEPPTIVSLDPPLYFARTAAAGQLRQREMTPQPGEDKALLQWVHASDDRLSLSDRVNLSSGDVLLIDADPALQEYVTIDTIVPIGAAELPATVTLTHPLAYAHRPGARVRRVVPQAPGPNRQLSQDAIAGDTCLFLNSLGGLSGIEVVEVFGGGAPAEFHRLSLFTTVSDAEGYYRLPLLSRVAKLELEATEGGDTATVTSIPNYLDLENRLDIAF